MEVAEGNASNRRNKPPDSEIVSLVDSSSPSPTLEPKSDEETDVGDSNNASRETNGGTDGGERGSRRQMLRRTSIESDVSLLSHESDDTPLLP